VGVARGDGGKEGVGAEGGQVWVLLRGLPGGEERKWVMRDEDMMG
jgi:hypothetical protein